MKIKVHGGVIGGDSRGLCASCEQGEVREDAKNNMEIWCGAWEFAGSKPHRISAPITRCTAYKPRGTVSRSDLEKIAWHITTDKKTGKVGFLTPSDRATRGED